MKIYVVFRSKYAEDGIIFVTLDLTKAAQFYFAERSQVNELRPDVFAFTPDSTDSSEYLDHDDLLQAINLKGEA